MTRVLPKESPRNRENRHYRAEQDYYEKLYGVK